MKWHTLILIIVVGLSHSTGVPWREKKILITPVNDTLSSLTIESNRKIPTKSPEVKKTSSPSNRALQLFLLNASDADTLVKSSPAGDKSPTIPKLQNLLENLRNLDVSNNSIDKLERELSSKLPKSAIISVKMNKRENLVPQYHEVQYDVPRMSDENYDKYTIHDFMNRNSLPFDFRAKLCKTDDGLVQSVEKLEGNETLGNCLEISIVHLYGILDLGKLGLRQFKNGWYKLPSDTIMKIDLSENEIIDITPQILNDLPSGVIHVNFAYNNIRMIKTNIINNTYIKKLEISYNLVSKIEDNAFENTKLKLLDFRENHLNDLDFVRTLPKTIRILQLSGNAFFRIPTEIFRGFKELKKIELIGCRIETIESNVFEDQEQLLNLHLSYNRIKRLKHDQFKGLNQLRVLDLSHNRIEKIKRKTFLAFTNSYNLFIDLAYNDIGAIERGSFSDLKRATLNLQHNKIRTDSIATGAFSRSSIITLTLNHNLIERINGGWFNGITELRSLYLNDNQIVEIREDDMKNMENLVHLSLDRNPLEHLESGALSELKQQRIIISVHELPFKSIQTGFFDDL